MDLKKTAIGGFRKTVKENLFQITLLTCFATPIMFLMVLDYLDIESFAEFNKSFVFLGTWKGRMFYLFFMWIFLLESIIGWTEIAEKKARKRYSILLFLACISIPLIYILSVNFLGFDQAIISLGQGLGFTDRTLNFHWVLSIEYLMITLSFIAAIYLVYGKKSLTFFSISSSLLMGITAIYTLDTFYPRGIFRPFELLALPTSACAAALLEILGYGVSLHYSSGIEAMPSISISVPEAYPPWQGAFIGWPCAGVHSLFLFVAIMLLLFKKSAISRFRKLLYFIVGAFCTYIVNVLRIASFFIILRNNGKEAARFFHDTIGELYFIFWIFAYILIIVSVEKFRLVERTRCGLHRLSRKVGKPLI